MAGPAEALSILEEVLTILGRLNVVHALTGAWASGLHGERRFTFDADFVVEPFPGREAEFVNSFAEDYHIELKLVEEAVRGREMFQVVHLPTSFKVDMFIRQERPFERVALDRRVTFRATEPDGRGVFVLTAEDIILFKMESVRNGSQWAEQQWRDAMGVLKVHGNRLDSEYLDLCAQQLGVTDLLARARQESGL